MWKMQQGAADYGRSQKWFEKKKPRELAAVLDNLDTFIKGLNEYGLKLEQVRTFGFVHAEPHGILAIDQKGGGRGLAETRLYVYPNQQTETIYLVTLGDKGSQSGDIELCRNFIAELRTHETGTHAPEEGP